MMSERSPSPEICIVGGGLSGLATAFYLQQQPELRHANIRLIEGEHILGGSYINTSHAHAGVLHALLKAPPKPPGDPNLCNSFANSALLTETSRDHASAAHMALTNHMLLKHTSVTPAVLQQLPTSNSSIKSFGDNGNPTSNCERSSISMEFGAGVPHILSPGGGHVLRLMQHLLMPSQLLIARKQAASLFSLMRSSKSSAVRGSWLSSFRERNLQSPSFRGSCRPGLTRLGIMQAVIAGFREIFLSKRALGREKKSGGTIGSAQQSAAESPGALKDMSVSSFAELHSSKALADWLLLPAFSACSYAGEAEKLSATSYFPRAWLLQQHYGSVLRGAWAERRATRRQAQEDRNSNFGSAKKSDGMTVGSGPHLVAVRGCRAFPQGHEALQRVLAEGAGVFSPAGGMRKLVEALEKHIVSPSTGRRPVTVVRGQRVVKIVSPQADGKGCTKGPVAEVVCDDGSRYLADLVISAVHPYDLGFILQGCERIENPYCKQPRPSGDWLEQSAGDVEPRTCGEHSGRSGVSAMASLLLALPCASWITVHAFGEHSSRRANSLGRGCFYSTDQLERLKTKPTQSQRQIPQQQESNDALKSCSTQAVAALIEAIQEAQEAVMLVDLQLPGNLFPHSHATALSAAGHFDSGAASWVTTAVLLHAQAAVRVRRIESLLSHMQQLLLPLQRLLQPTCVREGDAEKRAAGLRALGLLIGVAEDAVVRALIREGITTAPDRLVLCSRLSLQAEPQWPVTLWPTQSTHEAIRRHRLSSLLKQFERLRDEQWKCSPPLHAACSDVPLEGENPLSWPPLEHMEFTGQKLEGTGGRSLPTSFADGRLLFHQLRVQNTPWLQVVGPTGSFSEWGAGAKVKDAAILAHQIARRFSSFPDIKPESRDEFISRLNGGWLEKSTQE